MATQTKKLIRYYNGGPLDEPKPRPAPRKVEPPPAPPLPAYVELPLMPRSIEIKRAIAVVIEGELKVSPHLLKSVGPRLGGENVDVVTARKAAVFVLRGIMPRIPVQQISIWLGGRDMSTISYMTREANRLAENDPAFLALCSMIRHQVETIVHFRMRGAKN